MIIFFLLLVGTEIWVRPMQSWMNDDDEDDDIEIRIKKLDKLEVSWIFFGLKKEKEGDKKEWQ